MGKFRRGYKSGVLIRNHAYGRYMVRGIHWWYNRDMDRNGEVNGIYIHGKHWY